MTTILMGVTVLNDVQQATSTLEARRVTNMGRRAVEVSFRSMIVAPDGLLRGDSWTPVLHDKRTLVAFRPDVAAGIRTELFSARRPRSSAYRGSRLRPRCDRSTERN